MALEPDAIDLEGLPRTIGGGLKREPVEELLKRVQWEYSQLYYEHKTLKDELERNGGAGLEPPVAREAAPGSSSNAATAPEHDDGPVARIERALGAPVASAAPEVPQLAESVPTQPIAQVPHRDIDDLARLVLAAAHRTSIELRESARRDAELMLKKARERVEERERGFEQTAKKRAAELVELDRDFEQAKAKRSAELEELEEMMREIRGQMRATLEVLIPHPDSEAEVADLPKRAETEDVTTPPTAETTASDDSAPQEIGHSEFEAAS